jgi:secondary thiamine-phosphate synthase enzyme
MHCVHEEVNRIIRESGIRLGTVQVFNVGSTGAVGAIEYEPGLIGDLPAILNHLMPPGTHYGHEQTWHDGNGHSHLQATLLGQSWAGPVRDGALYTGTWQQVFHLECDKKPRTRTLLVTVQGE